MSVLEYIPPARCLAPLAASPLAAFNSQGPGFRLGSCEAAVFGALTSLQSATDCSQVAAAGFMNYGLGSTMHYLIVQLQRALRDSRPIAFVGEWVYGGCEARDFSCALEPVSACNKTGVATLDYPRMEAEQFPWEVGPALTPCMRGRGGGWGGAAESSGTWEERSEKQADGVVRPDRAPPGNKEGGIEGNKEGGVEGNKEGGIEGNALFHFVSTLAGFIFRANDAMRSAADAARRRIGLPEQ